MKLFIFVAILTTIIIQNGSCGKLKKVVKKLEATVEVYLFRCGRVVTDFDWEAKTRFNF